jgi:Fur family ferric uptake transcriptional regulator
MKTIKKLECSLAKYKIKPTTVRLMVLEFLLEQKGAIGMTDLYEAFEKSNRITLYRTLKVFEGRDLVQSYDDGTGVPKYALSSDVCDVDHHDDAHIHFHCDVCGDTYILPNLRIAETELPENFIKHGVNLVINGKCGACALNKEEVK